MNVNRTTIKPGMAVAVLSLALLAGATLAAKHSTSTRAPGPALTTDYNSFRIISERNIFNQTRAPHGQAPMSYRRPVPTRTVSDSFSLVGTLAYATNRVAFFDSGNPDYHRALQLGEKIGGYKLVAVLPDSVALDAAGRPFEMKVGMQLRRFAEGGAQLATTNETYVASTNASATAGSTTSGGPAVDANEVLRKLMEKRAQELK